MKMSPVRDRKCSHFRHQRQINLELFIRMYKTL